MQTGVADTEKSQWSSDGILDKNREEKVGNCSLLQRQDSCG